MAITPEKKGKKKPMSFGKILAVFFGGFFGLLLLAVIITKLATRSSAPVVQQRFVAPKVEDRPKLDIEDALQESEKRRRGEEIARQNAATLSRIEQQQGQIAQAVNANMSATQAIENRVGVLEAGQSGRGSRTPRTSVAEELAKRARIADPNAARTVAIVAGRAWVNQGGAESDVTVGETVPSTELRAHAIDAESSVVLTKPTKR